MKMETPGLVKLADGGAGLERLGQCRDCSFHALENSQSPGPAVPTTEAVGLCAAHRILPPFPRYSAGSSAAFLLPYLCARSCQVNQGCDRAECGARGGRGQERGLGCGGAFAGGWAGTRGPESAAGEDPRCCRVMWDSVSEARGR